MASLSRGKSPDPLSASQVPDLSAFYVKRDLSNVGALSLRNKLINGDFRIWQRGTGPAGGGYLADRWTVNVSNLTVSQYRPGGTIGEKESASGAVWIGIVSAITNGAAHAANIVQHIEGVRTLSGRRVTFSGWMYAPTGKLGVRLIQNFGTGGSTAVTVSGSLTLTPVTWEYKTISLDLPSVLGKTIGADDSLMLVVDMADPSLPGGVTGNQTGTFGLSRLQLEDGAVATPFEERPQALEEILCQRYYQVRSDVVGTLISAGENQKTIHFPRMRINPAINIASGANGAAFSVLGPDSIRAVTSATQFSGCTIHLNAEL